MWEGGWEGGRRVGKEGGRKCESAYSSHGLIQNDVFILCRYLCLHFTKAVEYLKLRFLSCCLDRRELPYKFYSGGSIGMCIYTL